MMNMSEEALVAQLHNAQESLRMAKMRFYSLETQLVNLSNALEYDGVNRKYILTEDRAELYKVKHLLGKYSHAPQDACTSTGIDKVTDQMVEVAIRELDMTWPESRDCMRAALVEALRVKSSRS